MRKIGLALTLAGMLLMGTVLVYANLPEASVTDKTQDGSILKTDDGITWSIDDSDQPTTALWMVGDTVIEDDNSKSCSKYELINKDENDETACAKVVK